MDTKNQFVAETIRELRAKSGKSQQAIADHLGQHQVVVARWEIGDRTPSLAVLPRLADALGISPQTLAKKLSENFQKYG